MTQIELEQEFEITELHREEQGLWIVQIYDSRNLNLHKEDCAIIVNSLIRFRENIDWTWCEESHENKIVENFKFEHTNQIAFFNKDINNKIINIQELKTQWKSDMDL